jgi:glycosyltransferase involved in cell wall biosynthesis
MKAPVKQLINSNYQYKFTVFTATYNRAHTLERVYKSLKSQNFRDFEWLIVDDGSKDTTSKIVEEWLEENALNIQYIYQKNSGKHIAFNKGVEFARGELFLNLDSDDYCVENALETFNYHWDNIPINQKEEFSGVTCLCKDENGLIIGNTFPLDIIDSNALEIRYKFKAKGEKWGFHKTDVLKKFPFPEISNSSYCPESIVWSSISKVYKTRFINETLRIYCKGEDQITKNISSLKKHTPGFVLWYKHILNTEISYLKYAPINFIHSSANYSRFSIHRGISFVKQFQELNKKCSQLLWFITMPLGFLLYIKDEFQLLLKNK